MESFNLNENLIVGDDYFIFDDEVSSSSLSDTDQSYTDSEGEQETAALPLVLESQMPSFFQAVKVQENKPIVAPTSTTISSRIQSALVAYLKPAKGREDQYTAGDFPISLLCNPYKYDLKLVGEICASKSTPMNISDLLSQSRQVNQEENDFLVVSLVDSETMTTPTLATGATPIKDKKDYLSVESITKVNQRERVVRFTFNLCSFHVKRRSFRLVVQNKNTGENVFVSSPFKTFARRRDHTTTSSGNSRQAYHQSLMNNMYFMQESKLKSRRAAPYPQVPQTKMNRFSPTAQSSIVVTTPENGSKTPVQQQQQPSTQPQMYAPMAMYAMNGYMYNGYQSGFTYPIESLLQNLGPQERTSLAIQLMSSLTPVERETVDFYLSCSGQCFAMNAPKQEQTNPCCFQMPTSGQSQVNSRV